MTARMSQRRRTMAARGESLIAAADEGVPAMVVRVEVAPALLRWAVDRAGWDEKTAESRAPHLDEWIRARAGRR